MHHEHEAHPQQYAHPSPHTMLESRVTRLEEGQTQLLSATSRIESIVENLASNQAGVATRMNRPWQWGVVVSGFVAIVTLAALFNQTLELTVQPIRENIEQLHEQEMRYRLSTDEVLTMLVERNDDLKARLAEQAVEVGRNAEGIKWLERHEDRDFTHFMNPPKE